MARVDEMANIVRKSLNLGTADFTNTAEVNGISDDAFGDNIDFEYQLDNSGTWLKMTNGNTDIDGIAASGTNDDVVLTRDGATLEISNTSGASVTVTDIRVTNTSLVGGDLQPTGPAIVPATTVSISIPNDQILQINSISFKIVEA